MDFDIHKVDAVESTNDEIKAASLKGAPEGSVVWALRQTGGRGRQGREWYSPEGNLYFSVLLRPPLPLRFWGNYSFVAGLAVHSAVTGILGKPAELKWPNDVLVDGKKISGILLETVGEALIVGIGINVQSVPEKPLYPVTSLGAEKAPPFSLEQILQKTLQSLDQEYAKMNAEGFGPIRASWLAVARKGSMRIRLPSGEGELSGDFQDLDAEGNLVLKLADGSIRRINAGDVFF